MGFYRQFVQFTIDTSGSFPSSKATVETVWHDEDDDNLEIDLSGTNRLKKLKLSKYSNGNTVISGGNFQKMLQER